MAVKQNGVLGTFTPTVTPYTNLTVNATHPNNKLATTAFNFYTCPAATLASGKIVVANNTGGAATVDIAMVEQTDIIQLDALASQPNDPNTGATAVNYGSWSFPSGQYTSSVVVEGAADTGTFQVGETVNWNNTNLSPNAQTAIVQDWDATNKKLWLRDMSHPSGLETAGDTTFTGATSGATIAAGPSHAGTGGTQGWSGRIKYYDSLSGQIYLNNYEFRNNIDYKLFGDANTENRELQNNNLNRSLSRIHRPVATTQNRFAAAGNTTPATEFIDAQGVELLVSAVTKVSAEQHLVKNKSINNQEIFELNGIVLGTYQSLFVSSSAAVNVSFIGFEETAEIPS